MSTKLAVLRTAWSDYLQFCAKILRIRPPEWPTVETVGLYIEYRLSAKVRCGKVLRKPLKATTMATRLASLRHLAQIAGHEAEGFMVLAKLLQKEEGRNDPATSALPIDKEMMAAVLAWLPMQFRLPALIAYKTASRWQDVKNLKWRDVRRISATETLVVFRVTKTNQTGKLRIDHVVLVSSKLIVRHLPDAATILPNQAVTDITTAQIEQKLSEFPVQPMYIEQFRTEASGEVKLTLSAHSFKKGAVDQLWAAAADGKIEPQQVAQTAKHRNVTSMTVPDTMAQYAPRLHLLARSIGTHKVTRMILIGNDF